MTFPGSLSNFVQTASRETTSNATSVFNEPQGCLPKTSKGLIGNKFNLKAFNQSSIRTLQILSPFL